MKNIVVLSFLFLTTLLASCETHESPKTELPPTHQADSIVAEKKYVPDSLGLYTEIVHMDSVMFDAFNAQNMEQLQSTFAENLEFYHDKGGLTDFKQTMLNFKGLFERNKTTGLHRVLIPGTLQVYPIKDFGAVETGEHQFCHEENGKQDCGTFKFMHVWQKKDGQWKVVRVISYDH